MLGSILSRACFNPLSRAGSDYATVAATIPGSRFQSTLPRGERPVGNTLPGGIYQVSIHAPARGATRWHPSFTNTPFSFNPRSRVESDRRKSACGITGTCFNPRSRVGSDEPYIKVRFSSEHVSTSAPVLGATELPYLLGCGCAVSIPAPAWGATVFFG